MKKRITRLPARQNAKAASILWVVLTIPFSFIALLMFFTIPDDPNAPPKLGLVFFMFAPLLYGVMGYFMTGLVAFVYNKTVKYTGGFEIETEHTE